VANGETHAQPLADTTAEQANNQNIQDGAAMKESKARVPRQPRQRGPPEDGIPSKNKVMVANLPYDLSEEKVGCPNLVSCWSPLSLSLSLTDHP
jgi:hypothetical protein